MRVQSLVTARDEDAICVPGDIIELRDPIAELWLKNKWAVRVKDEPGKIESAAFSGAPEMAVSRRGGRRRPKEP